MWNLEDLLETGLIHRQQTLLLHKYRTISKLQTSKQQTFFKIQISRITSSRQQEPSTYNPRHLSTLQRTTTKLTPLAILKQRHLTQIHCLLLPPAQGRARILL